MQRLAARGAHLGAWGTRAALFGGPRHAPTSAAAVCVDFSKFTDLPHSTSAAATALRGLASQAQSEVIRAPSSSSGGGARGSDGAGGIIKYLLLVPSVVAASLTWWQSERYKWKKDLLELRQSLLTKDPVDMFGMMECPNEYTTVCVEGEYKHDKSIHVGPRAKTDMGASTGGWVLLTPMYNRRTRQHIIVNRGWIPEEMRDNPAAFPKSWPKGKVQEFGIVRESENPGGFVPDNVSDRDEWFWIDRVAIARRLGLPDDTPLVEIMLPDDDTEIRGAHSAPSPMEVLSTRASMPHVEKTFPQPKTRGDFLHFSVMPDDHLSYASIWATLSVAIGIMAIQAIRGKALFRFKTRKRSQ